MEVISAEPPMTNTEESVGANGRRRTRGTYTLKDLPDGGTDIQFELAYLAAPPLQRLFRALDPRIDEASERKGDAPPRTCAQRTFPRLQAILPPEPTPYR